MPDNRQRQGSKQKEGNKLDKTAKKSVTLWKQLRGFIIKSYTSEEEIETAVKEVGIAYYDKAAHFSHSDVSLLLSAGLSFLNANIDMLTNGGMPARFIEAYTGGKTAFDEQQALYGTAKRIAKDGTIDKIAANNRLFTATTNMFAVAATIFVDDPELRDQFTKAAILRLITTDSVSGLHFLVRDIETGKPLETATISIVGQAQTYSVNKRGAFIIRLPKATYYFTVTIPGYPVYQGLSVLDANVLRRVEVLVKKRNPPQPSRNTGAAPISTKQSSQIKEPSAILAGRLFTTRSHRGVLRSI